ncbi:MAG: ABC transporter permease subunit [Rhizobiales bacterium]|nr:ABC transporter permease subunit [Hyphomicrobiales bacterium]
MLIGLTLRPLSDIALRQRSIAAAEKTVATGANLALAVPFLVFVYALTLYGFVAEEPISWLVQFPVPKSLAPAVASVIDSGVNWITSNWSVFFDAITVGLRNSLNFVEVVFVNTPWPVTVLVVLVLAYRLAGPRTTIFTAASLAYIGLLGLWAASMSTLALVAVSVIICVFAGIPVGVLCAKSPRLQALVEPVLDVMQTLPTFVYLIPAVALFSIGKPPGVIATVIFALPSMIRLTELGIRQVPANVREAANAFGASPLQLLFKVELPLAVPSIRLGVNQTIMMSLSMVVVAALIGAGGLGDGVMKALQHLRTGQGFLVGFAIVLCAMVLDRMVRGAEAERRKN